MDERLKGLFNENADIVKMAASKYKYVKSGCEYEDVLQNGYLGLHKACLKSDGIRNFRAFAFFKIRGQIVDGLREVDWVTRVERQKIKSGEYDFSMSLFEPSEHDQEDTSYCNDHDYFLSSKLQDAVSWLSPRDVDVLKSYFFDMEKQRDTAKRLGVSTGRINQIRKKILKKLKEHLISQGVGHGDI